MAETDTAYIGIQPCGCITLAVAIHKMNGRQVPSERELRADLKRAIKEGLTIEKTTVGEARKRENFLVQCPHRHSLTTKDVIEAEVDRLVAT